MPSFLFSPGLLIDFLIQYLLEWDFQGCFPPTASAGVTLVSIKDRGVVSPVLSFTGVK